jgi:hypothetical protein
MARSHFHLVQLHKFWTSNALIFAKRRHLKQGYFYPFHGQQFSYIVYDNKLLVISLHISVMFQKGAKTN